MKSKYKPISDGLILEDNLIDPRGKASMPRRKEVQYVDRKTD